MKNQQPFMSGNSVWEKFFLEWPHDTLILNKGDIYYPEDYKDSVAVVAEGLLKVFLSDAYGEERFMWIIEPWSLIHWNEQHNFSHSLVVIKKTKLYLMKRQTFMTQVRSSANLFEEYMGLYQLGAAYTGLFALLGHAFPIWYKFKGGKGFLAYMSVIWFIDWRAGLVAVSLMIILLLLTKYMSLSTVVAMLSCPVTLYFTGADVNTIWLCAASVLFIAFRHKENFKRLMNGTENKFSLSKK